MVCCWIYPVAAAGSYVGALNSFEDNDNAPLIVGILAHACSILLFFVGWLKFSVI